MNPQHTLPVAIGAKATLPNGTVIEILGVANGQVGLMVTEATIPTRPRKRGSNGHTALAPCYTPGSWEYWTHYKRKSWAGWFRKYKTVTDWLAANPGAVEGRLLTLYDVRSKGFDCTGKPFRKQYPYWSPETLKRHPELGRRP